MAATSERNRRPAERLTILKDAARSLLSRLDDVAAFFNNENSNPEWNKKKMSKVVACFEKLFPKYPSLSEVDKSQGPEDLQLNGKKYCEDMEEQYLALHDAVELRGEIWKVLTEIADDYACPTFDDFPNIAALYLDLFVSYVQICLMLTNIRGREMLACFYAYCYQYATGFADTNFSRLANMLHERCKTREGALAALRKEMAEKPADKSLRRITMVEFLGRLVLGPFRQSPSGPADPHGEAGVLGALERLSANSLLLEEDLLGLVAKLDSIEYPAGLGCIRDEWSYYQLPMLGAMASWLSHVYIVCPQLCYSHQRGMDGLRALVRAEWVEERGAEATWTHIEMYKVFHDKNYIAEFDKELKDKGGFKKGKADYKEAVESFMSKAGAEHRARRQYLKERIVKMRSLLSDCPGLLAPQMHLVQAVLGVAREEVMWYWRHKTPQPKEEKKHAKMKVEALGGDDEAVALIAAALSLRRTAIKHTGCVAEYYQRYLREVMAPVLEEAIQRAAAQAGRVRGAEAQLGAVVETCRRAAPEEMAGLRLDVDRVLLQMLREHRAASGDGPELPVAGATKQLARALQKTSRLSWAASEPHEELLGAASLHALWWKKGDFPEAFRSALRASPGEAMGMVEVYDDFVRAGNRAVPRQLAAIGEEAMREAGERMKEVCLEAVSLVRRLQRQFAGTASASPSMDLLVSISELCAFAVKDGAAIRVYRAEFRGGEYLLSALMQDLSVFIRDCLWGAGGRGRGALQSLAEAESQVQSYLSALRTMETYSGMPLQALHAECAEAVGVTAVGARGQDIVEPVHAKMFVDPEGTAVGGPPVVEGKGGPSGEEARAIGEHYVAMLRGNKPADEGTVASLRPLARLLGPGGVKIVDLKLLRRCKELAGQVAKTLQSNAPALKALAEKDAGRFDAAAAQGLAGLSGVHDMAVVVAELGAILDLRRRLHRALLEAMDGTLLPEGLGLAVSLTGSVLRSEHTKAVDMFAHDCGGSDGLWPVDPALHAVLVAEDGPISESSLASGTWDHVVYALASMPTAALFYSTDPGRACGAPAALIAVLRRCRRLGRSSERNAELRSAAQALVVLSVSARQRRQASGGAVGPAELEAAVQKSVADLVACTGSVAVPILLAGDPKKGRKDAASIPKVVAFLESLVQAAEPWSPTVRKRALPDSLSRCLHLSQHLLRGPVAHAYDDDDFD